MTFRLSRKGGSRGTKGTKALFGLYQIVDQQTTRGVCRYRARQGDLFFAQQTVFGQRQRCGRHAKVCFSEGGILWNGKQYSQLVFQPSTADASFSLHDVTIGVDFHWERKETQTFLGTLKLVVEVDKICAINELPIEKYLESVISSEMRATSGLELLKAHAVISRSWLLAQMERRRKDTGEGNDFFRLSSGMTR